MSIVKNTYLEKRKTIIILIIYVINLIEFKMIIEIQPATLVLYRLLLLLSVWILFLKTLNF